MRTVCPQCLAPDDAGNARPGEWAKCPSCGHEYQFAGGAKGVLAVCRNCFRTYAVPPACLVEDTWAKCPHCGELTRPDIAARREASSSAEERLVSYVAGLRNDAMALRWMVGVALVLLVILTIAGVVGCGVCIGMAEH